MPPQPTPTPVTNDQTDALLEHILTNGDDNAKQTQTLLEHVLVSGDNNAKEQIALNEHLLVKTDEVVQALKGTADEIKGIKNQVSLDAGEASVIELKGDKGDVGPQGEVGATGPQGDKGDKGDKG